MSLDSLLDELESVTPVTPCNVAGVTSKHLPYMAVTCVTSVTPKKTISEKTSEITPEQETAICIWLDHIGESKENHYLVLDKCKRNPEALIYFMKWTEQIPKQQPKEFSPFVTGNEFSK